MEHIFNLLQKLDSLYYSSSLEDYETAWQEVASQVRQMLPGLSLAYAEIYNAGRKREAHGGMRHVLLPEPIP